MSVSEEAVVVTWLRQLAGTDRLNISAPLLDNGEFYLGVRFTPADRSTNIWYREPVVEVTALARPDTDEGLAPWHLTEQLLATICDTVYGWSTPTQRLRVGTDVVHCSQPSILTPPRRMAGGDEPGTWAGHTLLISLPYQV